MKKKILLTLFCFTLIVKQLLFRPSGMKCFCSDSKIFHLVLQTSVCLSFILQINLKCCHRLQASNPYQILLNISLTKKSKWYKFCPSTITDSLQYARAKFLIPYIVVQSYNELWFADYTISFPQLDFSNVVEYRSSDFDLRYGVICSQMSMYSLQCPRTQSLLPFLSSL